MKIFLLIALLVCTLPAWAQNALTVRVVDEAGKPLADAQVSMQLYTRDYPKATTKAADASGEVVFSVPDGDDGKPVPSHVVASAPGFVFKKAFSVSEAEKAATFRIELERGQTWSGKVVDENDQPIGGAKVTIRGAIKGRDYVSLIQLEEGAPANLYSAKTGADGRFEIAGLPADMNLLYRVSAPKFTNHQGQDGRAGTPEEIKLKPGGAVRGKAFDAAGKPLSGVDVYASSANGMGGSSAKTDADGGFLIQGLAPDEYALKAIRPKDAPWVMPRLEGVRIEAEKTIMAKPLRAQTGVEIRGLARDAATKKPLADAHFGAQSSSDKARNNDAAYEISGKDGRFVLRVLPDQYNVRSNGAPFGYLRSSDVQTVTVKADTPANITFDLKSAPTVRGITLDENGKPIAAKITVGGFGQTIESDAQGKWQYTPSSNEDLTFGGGSDDEAYFEVVTPKRVDFPVKGALTITVRRKPWQSLEGRVVTPDGAPVEGAKVEASFVVLTGDSMGYGETVSAVSDAQGRYKLEKLRDSRRRDVMGTEVEVSAKKAGFQYQSGGKVTRKGDQPVVSDLVFAALSASLAGTTRAGASVVVAGRETLADATGAFKFDALPAGELMVYAAQDDLFGSAPTSQTPLRIELQRPPLQGRDEVLARELWAQIMAAPDADGLQDLDAWRAQPDFAANLKRAQTGNDKWQISGALGTWKRGDSLEELRAGLEAMEPSELRASAFLNAALTSNDAALTERALEEAQAQLEAQTDNKMLREQQLYQVAVLTERRDGADAGAFALRAALAYTLTNHPLKSRVEGAMQTAVGRNEALGNAASIVAPGSPALLRELLDSIEIGSGHAIKARAEAIPIVAQARGFEAAVPLLEELQAMPVATLDTDTNYLIFDVNYAFGQAVQQSIPVIGATDPTLALEWAQKVVGDEQRARALASAARYQSLEVAAPLLREAVEKIDTEDAPRLAAYAYERDAGLGGELFAIARRKASDEMNGDMVYRNAWIPYAFYSARFNPAQSRLILEREWSRSRESKADADALATIAVAMSPMDARRATEMARELGAPNGYWSRSAQVKIARYLVADDATRNGFALNRIGAREAWEADTPQW